MNQLTKEITSLMYPHAALIVYKTERDDRYFLELRRIGDDGRMESGSPVTVEFMESLVHNFSANYHVTPCGRIPARLLACDTRMGSERYVWYNPPQKRMMFFKGNLGIENAEYHLPGIIYDAGAHGMRIYAYKGKMPTERTPLYAAPFFNVSGAGVCLGSAELKRPSNLTFENLLEYWEKIFWLTEFSHLGSRGNPTKSNLVLVTKAARNAPFDLDELKPLNNLKLKDILK